MTARQGPVGVGIDWGIGWQSPARMVSLARAGWLFLAAALAMAALAPATTGKSISGGESTVVVAGAPGSESSLAMAIESVGGQVREPLTIINGFVADVPTVTLPLLARFPAVRGVTVDGSLKPDSVNWSGSYSEATDTGSLYSTSVAIGAQDMWQSGYTGKGVDIALIDSGVAPVDGLNAPGKVINGPDLTPESQSSSVRYLDTYGHGTHVGGIIAGRDTRVAAGSSYVGDTTNFYGIAPDARLISVKVADSHGATDVSQVIAAIDWVVQHRHDNGMNIRVINLAYGTNSRQPYGVDPLAYAAEVAWRAGIVVVAAAGNLGPAAGQLNDPAVDPFVIAVGASDPNGSTDEKDSLAAAFSSAGDGERNPDLLAPGVHIQSLRDPGSYIDQQFGSTGQINSRFFRGSGTSQATGVVSGSVALLLQENPGLTPDDVKHVLTSTGRFLPLVADRNQGDRETDLALAQKATGQNFVQKFTPSAGTGTLDGARGSLRVVQSGVALSGQQDIFGQSFDSTAMAQAEAEGTSWSGGVWNGTSWSGTSWSGTSWSGTSWSGTSWSGTSWSGTSWSGTSWSGTSWSGTSWSGTSWSGTSWSGTSWSDHAWSAQSWT